jgi:hypothetical protein
LTKSNPYDPFVWPVQCDFKPGYRLVQNSSPRILS